MPEVQHCSVASVSLVIIAYNEAETLPGLLEDILAQDYPRERIELLLVDSHSNDGTRFIMQDFVRREREFLRIELLENPGRYLPQGCNIALAHSCGDAFVRVDAHARLPADFVRRNVERLNLGEDICGGPRPVILKEPSSWGFTLLAAEQSAFGASPARYRRVSAEGLECVNSVFHAAYRRAVVDKVGPFDERLRRTEDNDYSCRARKAGYRICFDPAIHSWQYLRGSLGALLGQKAGNGFWIGVTLWLSAASIRPFHLVPTAFVFALLAALVAGFVVGWVAFLALLALYLLVAVAVSLWAAARSPRLNLTMLALPFVFLAMHLCYGATTFVGLARGAFLRFGRRTGRKA
jgi:GT2 family glycosyltransferase